MIYSRREACNGNLKLPVCICLNRVGTIEVLSNGYIATGGGVGRMLNVAGCWAAGEAEAGSDDAVGIDGGCQSEEEYGSDE
jgi:hypothetical protein